MKKKGFTLIELLVVISIIALLLSILMPALSKVKKQAKAVVCKSNLHQWGLSYQLYTNDWNSKLPVIITATSNYNISYMESLRDYYGNINELRTCPSAKKVSRDNPTTYQPESFFGGTFTAWQIDPTASWLADDDWGIGSYTENSWIRSSDLPLWQDGEWGSIINMGRPSEVPLLLDGRWHDSRVFLADNSVPAEAALEIDFYNVSNWESVRSLMMRRHKDGINVVMADMSANQISTEDLWTLKWHRQFEKVKDVDLSWLK